MKVIAVNGSPRKNWNTDILLGRALEGAASQKAETERVHLYDLQFKGCTSCFACKKKGGPRVCAMQDGLTPLLEKLHEADGIIFGSPVYFMKVTSGMAAFLERFLFQYNTYNVEKPSAFPRKVPSLFIYTMNITQDRAESLKGSLNPFDGFFIGKTLGGEPETLCAYNTYQYPDYSKYEHSMFSEPEKAKHKKEQFPLDCERAFQMGAALAKRSGGV